MSTLLEQIIIGVLLILATYYLVRKFKENFASDKGCTKCNACSKIDFDKIEKQIQSKKG